MERTCHLLHYLPRQLHHLKPHYFPQFLTTAVSCLGLAGSLIGASFVPWMPPLGCKDLSIKNQTVRQRPKQYKCQIKLTYVSFGVWISTIWFRGCWRRIWVLSTSNFGHFLLKIFHLMLKFFRKEDELVLVLCAKNVVIRLIRLV